MKYFFKFLTEVVGDITGLLLMIICTPLGWIGMLFLIAVIEELKK